RSDLAAAVTLPDVLFQPHSAPLQIAFYDPPARRAGALPRRVAGPLRRTAWLLEPGRPDGL
ncbi:MAG: hypothetical protein KGI57_11935, partial [Hyphomicrobiales bacterium]|nr:hypothetical protein [Hyphomicrobiales bacterium]